MNPFFTIPATTEAPNLPLPSSGKRAARLLHLKRPTSLRHALTLLLTLFLLSPGCATYQVGNQTLYPTEIHTVYVPIFQSVSFRRNLGERLTEAVMKEIELKTPYKVVSDPNADSVLTGRIVNEGKNLLLNTRNGDPRDVEVHMNVEVSWIDRKGRILRENGCVPITPDVLNVLGTSDVVSEFGQSVTTAQQAAIEKIAQQVVSLMEQPW